MQKLKLLVMRGLPEKLDSDPEFAMIRAAQLGDV